MSNWTPQDIKLAMMACGTVGFLVGLGAVPLMHWAARIGGA
jgi:hypothetical protein